MELKIELTNLCKITNFKFRNDKQEKGLRNEKAAVKFYSANCFFSYCQSIRDLIFTRNQ